MKLLSLNLTRGTTHSEYLVSAFAKYDKRIYPNDMTLESFFMPCVHLLVSETKPTDGIISSQKIAAQTVKVNDHLLRLYRDSISPESHIFNWTVTFSLIVRKSGTYWVLLKIRDDILGPAQSITFTKGEDKGHIDDEGHIEMGQNQLGMSLLHYMACFNKIYDKMPLKFINHKDSYGNIPLHYAQELRNDLMIDYLINAGSNKDMKNHDEMSFNDRVIMEPPKDRMQKLGINDNKLINILTKEIHYYFDKISSLQEMSGKERESLRDPVINMNDRRFALRIVLIESHTKESISRQSPSDIFSPRSTGTIKRSTGKYQFAICIGPCLLEWNEISFIVPKVCLLNMAHYVFNTGYFVGFLDKDIALSMLYKFINNWNMTKTYNVDTCNSQHFNNQLLKTLTNKTFKGMNWESFNKSGYKNEPEIVLSEALRVGMNRDKIFHFTTRQELDSFLRLLKDHKLEKLMGHDHEFYFMCKSYDELLRL